MNPLPLIEIIIGIRIFRPFKGEGLFIMGLHYLDLWPAKSEWSETGSRNVAFKPPKHGQAARIQPRNHGLGGAGAVLAGLG